MRYAKLSRQLPGKVCVLAIACCLLLQPVAAWAGQQGLDSGQLSFAQQVVVNGQEAAAGQRIFSGARIKVGSSGKAIINLGRLGRVELGADSDFFLYVSDKSIGGELSYGCMKIGASQNVATSVAAPGAKVTSDGKDPASISIGSRGGTSNAIPYLSEVKVVAGDLVESARPGEIVIWSDGPGAESKLRRISASECGRPGVSCVCNTGVVANNRPANRSGGSRPAATATQAGSSSLIPVLAASGIAAFAVILSGATSGSAVSGAGLTCTDSAGIICRFVSPITFP